MGKLFDIVKLVEQAQKGNIEAFGKIYDALIDRVYRFVYFRTGAREEAEDLTEEIFLKAYKNIRSFEKRNCPFEAWIFRIARNAIIDHYRTKKNHIKLDQVYDLEDDQQQPQEDAENQILYRAVLRQIYKLPDRYQEIIILRFIEGKKTEEIGFILQKPAPHVRVLQSRAIKLLKNLFTDQEYTFDQAVFEEQ